MNIYTAFKSKSTTFYILLVLLGAANSVLYSSLLILVNNSINRHNLFHDNRYNLGAYFGVITLSFICSRIFQTYIVRLSNGILYKFEVDVLKKLRFSEFEDYEKLGANRVYTAIGDTKVLSRIPETFISVFNACIIVLCCIGYMFFVSIPGGLFIIGMMTALLLIYLRRNKSIEVQLNRLRDLQNTYYQYLDDLLHGFRELKLGVTRNKNLFDNHIFANKQEERDLGVVTAVKYLDNELLGSYSWYIILGLIMYVLPMMVRLNMSQTSTFIITVLYLIGPVGTLISTVPFYTRVKISLQRLNEYEQYVQVRMKNDIGYDEAFDITGRLESIRFDNTVYQYLDGEGQPAFSVGPVNMEIARGEMIFIVGGNGSGKSTFINLLTGLYKPSGGNICFNGRPIDKEEYPWYSNKISAIFTGNHLFHENYEGFDLTGKDSPVNHYIEKMRLTDIVKIDPEKNHISHKLSKGQQKRVAMIYALMEQREILVLDEWAAEQDPAFRAYFYRVVLKEIKKMGKTVVAVTHDDAYFDCADRVVKFDYGRIVETIYKSPRPAIIENVENGYHENIGSLV